MLLRFERNAPFAVTIDRKTGETLKSTVDESRLYVDPALVFLIDRYIYSHKEEYKKWCRENGREVDIT